MFDVHILVTHFINCNLPFCVYSAFGLTSILRAAFCSHERNFGEAREHFVHGIVYLTLGLLDASNHSG
jgi:hypothetical protein